MAKGTRLPHAFGRYVLREKVAAGGMAEVFRATQPGFGGFEKAVAIKRMYRQYSHDTAFVEMLSDEAKIVSQLNHPNIVQILDIGQVHDDYYIALEFVEGVDLFRLLQRQYELGRDLPLPLVIYIIAELCSALDHAHARRTPDGDHMHIIHRDVSPQNVLLSNHGEVKLTDFGIAKARYRYTQTQAGVVKGKLYYMSPEQARGTELDHRSDLFAAGILLYELLSTRPLYDEEEQARLLSVVGRAEYTWPADKKTRLPPAIVAVTDRALHRSAGQRYETGREFRAALLRVGEQLGKRCDREQFGTYLRKLFDVPDDRPPLVDERARARNDTRDYSVVHWATRDKNAPPRVEVTGDAATPGSSPTPTVDLDQARQRGQITTNPKSANAAKRVLPRSGSAKAAPPLDDPLAPPRTLQLDTELPPPVPLSGGFGAPDLRVPDTDDSTALLDTAAVNRVLGGDPQDAAQDDEPPTRSPVAAAVADDQEKPTAMLDLAKIGAALGLPQDADASGSASRPTPTIPAKPQPDRPIAGPSMPRRASPPPRPAPAPAPDAATKMHAVMPDAPAGPLAPPSPPVVIPAQAAPVAAVKSRFLDADDQPASWTLLGVTGLIWAGVVVLGVYATLLVM